MKIFSYATVEVPLIDRHAHICLKFLFSNFQIFLITQTRDMIMERSLINAVGKYAYVKVFFSKIVRLTLKKESEN